MATSKEGRRAIIVKEIVDLVSWKKGAEVAVLPDNDGKTFNIRAWGTRPWGPVTIGVPRDYFRWYY